MAYFDPIDTNIFNLGDLGTFQSRDVTESISSFSVSLSMSQSSQISVGVIDPEFIYATSKYFQIRRDIFYRNLFFEISAVEVQRSPAIHPLYTLECRSKAVQLMKRDKKPEAYRGMTAFDFAAAIAKRFSLNFVGERTTKKQSIVKGKSRNSDDSVWTVLQSLASEQKFVCFESEGTLFFCSEQFLLGKWGDPKCAYGDFKFIPFFYPEPTDPFFLEFKDKYILLEMPTVRRSDDDIKAADGTLIVDRFNGIHLRPGMTIYLGGIPDFEGFYIITDVQFDEGVPDPVRVSFRVPVDPNKESISTSTASGSNNRGGTGGNNAIAPPVDGTTSTLPTIISVTGSRLFAERALRFLKYRGTNTSVIQKLISNSVKKIIERSSTTEKERASLLSAFGLSEQEREFASIIFVWYLSGRKIETLGASGGVSQNAISQTADQIARQYGTTQTDGQAGTPAPGGARDPQQERLAGIDRNLPSATVSAINSYIDANAPAGTIKTDKDKAKQKAAQQAKNIYLAPTNTAKLKLLKDYRSTSGSQFTAFTLNKAVFNSIRQMSVLRVIYPISQSISSSELNATVPQSWPITR